MDLKLVNYRKVCGTNDADGLYWSITFISTALFQRHLFGSTNLNTLH